MFNFIEKNSLFLKYYTIDIILTTILEFITLKRKSEKKVKHRNFVLKNSN